MATLKEKKVGDYVVKEASYRALSAIMNDPKLADNIGEALISATVYKDDEVVGDDVLDLGFTMVQDFLDAALELNGLGEKKN